MNGEKDSLLQQQQEKLNKTEQELETLLGRLGNELGLQVKQGETGGEKALTNDDYEAIIAQEDGNPLLNNEENILKLLKSLDNAGKIMDLIDVRADSLLEKMDKIIVDLNADDDNLVRGDL